MYIPDLIKRKALRRGLRINTIKTYQECLRRFFKYYLTKDPKKITKKDIENYLDYLIDKKYSNSTVNVYLCSLKFLFTEILGKKLLVKMKFSKVPKKLPIVLSKKEMINLLYSIKNPKHNLMISLMYSAGLRVGELVNLMKRDIDFDRNCGWIRNGKGGKDRPFVIAGKLNKKLKDHIMRNCKSQNDFLFRGRKGQIRRSTIQKIIKNSACKAKITKNIHPHTLRHSFSTHLIEDGFSFYSVQNLLGHQSPETTMMYVHIAKTNLFAIISPYDNLVQNS